MPYNHPQPLEPQHQRQKPLVNAQQQLLFNFIDNTQRIAVAAAIPHQCLRGQPSTTGYMRATFWQQATAPALQQQQYCNKNDVLRAAAASSFIVSNIDLSASTRNSASATAAGVSDDSAVSVAATVAAAMTAQCQLQPLQQRRRSFSCSHLTNKRQQHMHCSSASTLLGPSTAAAS